MELLSSSDDGGGAAAASGSGTRTSRWTPQQDNIFASLVVKCVADCAGKPNFNLGDLLVAEAQKHSVALGRTMSSQQALGRLDYMKRGCQAVYAYHKALSGPEPYAFFNLSRDDKLTVIRGGTKGNINKMTPTREVYDIMLSIVVADKAFNPDFTLAAGVQKVQRTHGHAVTDLTRGEDEDEDELDDESRQQVAEQRRGRNEIWADDPASTKANVVAPHQLLKRSRGRQQDRPVQHGASEIAGAIRGMTAAQHIDRLTQEVTSLRDRVDMYRKMIFTATSPEDKATAQAWARDAESELQKAIKERDEAREPATQPFSSAGRSDPPTAGRAGSSAGGKAAPAAGGRAAPAAAGRADPAAAGRAAPAAAGRAAPAAAGRADPAAAGRADPAAAGRADPAAVGRADPAVAGRADPAAAGRVGGKAKGAIKRPAAALAGQTDRLQGQKHSQLQPQQPLWQQLLQQPQQLQPQQPPLRVIAPRTGNAAEACAAAVAMSSAWSTQPGGAQHGLGVSWQGYMQGSLGGAIGGSPLAPITPGASLSQGYVPGTQADFAYIEKHLFPSNP